MLSLNTEFAEAVGCLSFWNGSILQPNLLYYDKGGSIHTIGLYSSKSIAARRSKIFCDNSKLPGEE